ncbi:MAG: RDD family protein [Armatimonadota bacterium]|nr:MAG: RDD family protein [Armatimonadota bacterium]
MDQSVSAAPRVDPGRPPATPVPDGPCDAQHLDPAAPWRRFAASVLDTAVLLLWSAFIFLVAVALAPESAAGLPLPFIGMASAVLYLTIGWAIWGMTLGKWALGIRVVTADGSRLSWGRAAARTAAFLVASAPLKAGLAAILWDRGRRGWHDHIAATMVVATRTAHNRRAARAFHPEADSHRSEADVAGPTSALLPGRPSRHSRLLACGMGFAYLLLALALTMPLALHFSTHIPGAPVEGLEQDGYMFLWDYWWVKTSLGDPDLHVMSTRYLFWPQEVSLRYHTLVLLHSTGAAALQNALHLVQTYNVLLILALGASAWSAFLLCRYVTGSTAAGAIAGLAFGFCPFMTTHALAHQNLIAAEWLAPFAYCALRALEERRARYLIGAGISWALIGLCEWYYFLYAAMLLAILVAAGIARYPRRWAGAAAIALGVVTLGVALLSPLLVPMLVERAQGAYMQQPLGRGAALGGQPGLYLTPAFTHPLLGRAGGRILRALGYSRAEATVYLGLVVLALALTGLAFRSRRLMPWTAGAAFFLVLALGPHLRLGDRTQFNALTLLLVGGAPGNGLDLPVTAGLSSRLAMELVGGGGFLTAQERIALPYLWLWKYVPITKLAAVPTRAVLPAMLCLAVMAAAGLAAVLEGRKPRSRLLIAGAAGALVLFEFMPAPYPLRDVRAPSFYQRLAQHRGMFAVAEVPLFGDCMIAMYYQTVHHKPILAGHVSRLPPHALDFVRGNALLSDLQPERPAPPGEPVLRLTRAGVLAEDLGELRAIYGPALAEAREAGVGLIVAHENMLTPRDVRALDRVLCDALDVQRRQHPGEIIAYHVGTASLPRRQ